MLFAPIARAQPAALTLACKGTATDAALPDEKSPYLSSEKLMRTGGGSFGTRNISAGRVRSQCGVLHLFSHWPNPAVPKFGAGVYTIWHKDGRFIYVGMSERTCASDAAHICIRDWQPSCKRATKTRRCALVPSTIAPRTSPAVFFLWPPSRIGLRDRALGMPTW
jgi:hypothetical protein